MNRQMSFAVPHIVHRTWQYPLGVLLGALLLSFNAHAFYKVVGPDGKVSYTDRPPVEAQGKVVPMTPQTEGGTGTPLANLPIEVREAATRYPVMLYTTANCAPCDEGRRMLKQRGIPFTERQVLTGEDTESLQKLTGGRETPVMVVGTQVNRGFNSDVWGQYLDAAGYPSTSRLPSSFVYSEAKPLTEPKAAPPAKPAVRPAPASQPAPPPQAPKGGLQF